MSTEIKYQPLYKTNQLLVGQGYTAVITGWTIKGALAKHLTSQEYAVIGQLYSPTRGLNYLLRNLLWNPHVRYLVVLDGTKEDKNSGGCQCLIDFFQNGFSEGVSDTGRRCWVVRSSYAGYIDIEVDAAALESLRKFVECKKTKSISEAVALTKEYAMRKEIKAWSNPQQFEIIEPQSTVLPGRRYGHRIEGRTIAETWVKIIHLIKTTGTIRPTAYDGHWQELIDLVAVVTSEPKDFYFPDYLPIERKFLLEEYFPQILEDTPKIEGVKYSYGNRLRSHFGVDQIEFAINKLISDPDSARVVMALWDPTQDIDDSPPCLNLIWLRVVDNGLSLTATFRSNDMFSAWCANAMGLRALQKHICSEIKRRSGRALYEAEMITISQSAHIYDDCWESAQKIIDSQYSKICQQERNFSDPAGSFVVSLQDGICVEPGV